MARQYKAPFTEAQVFTAQNRIRQPEFAERPAMVNDHKWRRALIRFKGLSDMVKLVGVMISEYRNAETGLCYPSASTLAADLGCMERSIRRAFAALVSNGFIWVVRRSGKTNQFLLTIPLEASADTPDSGYRGIGPDSHPPPDSGVIPPLSPESGKRDPNDLSNAPPLAPSPFPSVPDEAYRPSNALEERAAALGLDLEAMRRGFLLNARAKGRSFMDHDAAFGLWIEREAAYRRRKAPAPALTPNPPPVSGKRVFIPVGSEKWPLVESQCRQRAEAAGRPFTGTPVIENRIEGRPIRGYYLYDD